MARKVTLDYFHLEYFTVDFFQHTRWRDTVCMTHWWRSHLCVPSGVFEQTMSSESRVNTKHFGLGPLLVQSELRELSACWSWRRPDDCDGARMPRCCTPIRDEHARPLNPAPANCKTPTKLVTVTMPAPANTSTSAGKQIRHLPRQGSFTQSLEEICTPWISQSSRGTMFWIKSHPSTAHSRKAPRLVCLNVCMREYMRGRMYAYVSVQFSVDCTVIIHWLTQPCALLIKRKKHSGIQSRRQSALARSHTPSRTHKPICTSLCLKLRWEFLTAEPDTKLEGKRRVTENREESWISGGLFSRPLCSLLPTPISPLLRSFNKIRKRILVLKCCPSNTQYHVHLCFLVASALYCCVLCMHA